MGEPVLADEVACSNPFTAARNSTVAFAAVLFLF